GTWQWRWGPGRVWQWGGGDCGTDGWPGRSKRRGNWAGPSRGWRRPGRCWRAARAPGGETPEGGWGGRGGWGGGGAGEGWGPGGVWQWGCGDCGTEGGPGRLKRRGNWAGPSRGWRRPGSCWRPARPPEAKTPKGCWAWRGSWEWACAGKVLGPRGSMRR